MTGSFDLHVHTSRSRDGHGSVLECAQAAKAAGLTGFAVTDHNTLDGHRQIKQAAARTGMLIVPGTEISTTQGHMLGLGVTGRVPEAPSMEEALAWAEAAGGIGVPSHPLRTWTGIGPTDLRELVSLARVEAIEVENGRDRHLVRRNVARLATELGLGAVGGSDAHRPDEVGTCRTLVDDWSDGGVEELVEAIRRGRTRAEGGKIPAARIWKHRLEMLQNRN